MGVGGGEVEEVFPARTEQSQGPPNSSLVCACCCSGDTAAGFGPDCRNISSMVESRIAGKDNETEGDGEGERRG